MRFLCLVFAVFIGVTLCAQDKDGKGKDKALLAKLKTPISVQFGGTALKDALEGISLMTGVQFVVQSKEDLSKVIILSAQDTPLGDVLKLIVLQLGPQYRFWVEDGVVVIGKRRRQREQGLAPPAYGQVSLLLKDGSAIWGVVDAEQMELRTRYGTLHIPLKEVGSVKRLKDGRFSVVTCEFTAVGDWLLENLVVKTKHGELTVKKDDIKQLMVGSVVSYARCGLLKINALDGTLSVGVPLLVYSDRCTFPTDPTSLFKAFGRFKKVAGEAHPRFLKKEDQTFLSLLKMLEKAGLFKQQQQKPEGRHLIVQFLVGKHLYSVALPAKEGAAVIDLLLKGLESSELRRLIEGVRQLFKE